MILVLALAPHVSVTTAVDSENSPVFETTPSEKFDATFEIESHLTYETLYITVINLQDSPDFLSLQTILSDTDFSIYDVSNVEFAVEQTETYQENVLDYDNVLHEVSVYDNDNILIGYENEWRWEVAGSHLEGREHLVWKSKTLTNKTEDGLKGELKHQWEGIPIQKAGQSKDTLRFRFTFYHPLVARATGWGSRGIISLDLNGETFVDLTASSWWDSNWSYRAPITLTVHPDNYQIRMVLDKVDNLGSHCLDNFQDLRFTENDDGPELNFWIENKIDGDIATVWVRRVENDVSCDDNVIYVYYGNASAGVAENGINTFILFDNFFGSALDTGKWERNTTYASVSGGILTYAGVGDVWINSIANFAPGKAVRVRNKMPYSGDAVICGFQIDPYGSPYQMVNMILQQTEGKNVMLFIDTGSAAISTNWDETNIYTTKEIIWNSSGNSVSWFENGVERNNSPYTGTEIPEESLACMPARCANNTMYVDWIFVRSYAYPDPAATVGAEETILSFGIPTIYICTINVNADTVNLEWENAVLAITHHIQIDNENDWDGNYEWDNASLADNNFTATLRNYRTYWRVRGEGATDNGAWSEVFSFNLELDRGRAGQVMWLGKNETMIIIGIIIGIAIGATAGLIRKREHHE